MSTVITYGTFDIFHVGHVHLLRRAREQGDRLIVAVSSDEFNAIKGKTSLMSYADRAVIVAACRYVDLVIPECDWAQKRRDIVKYGVDVFVMGDDWQGRFDELSDLCEVRYLPRTPDVSSSWLKEEVQRLGAA